MNNKVTVGLEVSTGNSLHYYKHTKNREDCLEGEHVKIFTCFAVMSCGCGTCFVCGCKLAVITPLPGANNCPALWWLLTRLKTRQKNKSSSWLRSLALSPGLKTKIKWRKKLKELPAGRQIWPSVRREGKGRRRRRRNLRRAKFLLWSRSWTPGGETPSHRSTAQSQPSRTLSWKLR